MSSTPAGSSLAYKYQARVEVNSSGKHTSLFLHSNYNVCKRVYSTDPCEGFSKKFQLKHGLIGQVVILSYHHLALTSTVCLYCLEGAGAIDIERKVYCSSVVMCLLQLLPLPREFLQWPLTVVTRLTRQAVSVFNHSILLKCLWLEPIFAQTSIEFIAN